MGNYPQYHPYPSTGSPRHCPPLDQSIRMGREIRVKEPAEPRSGCLYVRTALGTEETANLSGSSDGVGREAAELVHSASLGQFGATRHTTGDRVTAKCRQTRIVTSMICWEFEAKSAPEDGLLYRER